MRSLYLALAVSFLLVSACETSTSPSTSDPPSADAIIDSAIAAHGGSILDRSVLSFDFRGDQYRLRHDEGRFHYRRTYSDSLGRTVTDGITNDSIYRRVNGDTVRLSRAEKNALQTTVNSVSYFTILPYRLDDPAVQSNYSGRDTLDGVPYHRIRVTFKKTGGGKDWQDVFYYWFRTDTYAMDYLSYAFGLAPGDTDTGTRFREAYNVRRIDGVRIADYLNYTVDTLATDRMTRYPDLWAQDALELVSRVEVDSVRIRRLSGGS